MSIIDPSDLVRINFHMPTSDESRWRLQATIVRVIEDYADDCAKDSSHFECAYSTKEGEVE